jgi:hypothetical protein
MCVAALLSMNIFRCVLTHPPQNSRRFTVRDVQVCPSYYQRSSATELGGTGNAGRCVGRDTEELFSGPWSSSTLLANTRPEARRCRWRSRRRSRMAPRQLIGWQGGHGETAQKVVKYAVLPHRDPVRRFSTPPQKSAAAAAIGRPGIRKVGTLGADFGSFRIALGKRPND